MTGPSGLEQPHQARAPEHAARGSTACLNLAAKPSAFLPAHAHQRAGTRGRAWWSRPCPPRGRQRWRVRARAAGGARAGQTEAGHGRPGNRAGSAGRAAAPIAALPPTPPPVLLLLPRSAAGRRGTELCGACVGYRRGAALAPSGPVARPAGVRGPACCASTLAAGLLHRTRPSVPQPTTLCPPAPAPAQVWLGRAAMAAFLALLAFETVHSNRPAFGTLWYLWF